MHLRSYHQANGAEVADDGIPLYYTDPGVEDQAAQHAAVLLDRSHEARLELDGADRTALLERMSTNHLTEMAVNEGRATIFTDPNARVLDRVLVINRDPALLLVGGPSRTPALLDYLRRSIFFNDRVTVRDLTPETAQFGLHGPHAEAVAEALLPGAGGLPPLFGTPVQIEGITVFMARRKPYAGTHWMIVAPAGQAEQVWTAALRAGQPHGLIAAGSLTFNVMRIRSGRPGAWRELTNAYIPLELGLWDEISFHKGCYTGQEIIARMESRGRLARTIVRLRLSAAVSAPADLTAEGRPAGVITSSVTTPDGEHLGIGVIRVALADAGRMLSAGEVQAEVIDRAGVQPPMIQQEQPTDS